MRHVILKDTKITATQYKQWVKEDTTFWKEQLGITPTYEVIDTNYSSYPTYVDSDGDIRPTDAYLQGLSSSVVKKYGEFGFDFIMVMVHQDNWKSDTTPDIKGDGIWGTNYSYAFGKHCLDYCRWDKNNIANTFGTAYHERHHSFDAIVKVETGVDVNPLLNVSRYDAEITHGGTKPWKYIRHKENLDSLKVMKPHLLKAFAERKRKHEESQKGMMETIIKLSTQFLYLWRMQQNKKNGVSDNL